MAKKTKSDPTGQRVNRRKTAKRLQHRLQRAERLIINDFRAIPHDRKSQKIIQNASLVLYQYDLSPDDLERLRLSIQSHLDIQLATVMDIMPTDWWYKSEIELPWRQGALEELVQFNQIVDEVTIDGVGIPPSRVIASPLLFSPDYLDGLRNAQVRNYGLITSLSEGTARQVYQSITSGIDAGEGPAEITRRIRERFDVADSNAKRIADTEVNRAYNDARLQTVTTLTEQSGVEVAVMHISSLLPTTRHTHAQRHGNLYTAEQQESWWNTGSNRINCHCTTRSVLLRDGRPVDSELQKRFKDMRFSEDDQT